MWYKLDTVIFKYTDTVYKVTNILFKYLHTITNRHSCATPDVYRKRILHLTPVRRSTRKNRQGPGMELDKNLCFDSPSEACTLEEFENVEVVPNQALV